MRKLQSQGVHHITIVGADRQTSIDCVHHVAFSLSQATFHQAVERLDECGIRHRSRASLSDDRSPRDPYH